MPTIQLQFTTMSNGPDAIGRHEGRAVFVPLALPGETALVEITEEKSSFARARLIEVLSASPDRVAPVCPHFGACGGCHWQNMAYPAQLKWKRQIVIDQLARIGGIESAEVRETIPAPEPLHYRNHVQFTQDAEGRLGFMAANSKAVVPIRECHIARPEIVAVFDQLDLDRLDVDRVGLRVGADGEAMIVFESESGAPPEVETDLPVSVASVDSAGEMVTLIGSDHLIEEVNGRRFRVSPGSFFQVNSAQAGTLARLVLEGLALRGGETVFDLYCGVGLFSAFIAPTAARVVGVESSSSAVRDAEVNLDEFDNVELYESPVEWALPHLLEVESGRDPAERRVVLDPPRSGCGKEVTDALIVLAAPRVVYVSCDPATLARDAKRLIAGGYRLASAQPLDMFPQTHHVETVAVFESGKR